MFSGVPVPVAVVVSARRIRSAAGGELAASGAKGRGANCAHAAALFLWLG